MLYTKLYQDQQELIKANPMGKKSLKMIFGKQSVSFQKYAHIMKPLLNDGSVGGKNISKLINEELQWRNDHSPVIFLETQDLVNDLYQAKFDFENDFNVTPPYKTFAMAFPKNTIVNGVELKSALATIMTRKEFIELYGSSIMTLRDFLCADYNDDELCICVNYANTNGVVDTNFAHLSKLTSILKNNSMSPLPDNGTNMLEALTKIALTLCVYNSATNGKKLLQGYPSTATSRSNKKARSKHKAITLHSLQTGSVNDDQSGKKVIHRMPHYRNLRAERYYQNEYKNMKRGSRWTFVREVDLYGSINTLVA